MSGYLRHQDLNRTPKALNLIGPVFAVDNYNEVHMTDMEIKTARFNMVEQQIRPWEVFDKRVLDLMGQAPRHEFVPAAYRNLAFADMHIPLGKDREMMSPKVEARLLQALEIRPTDKILEVGTGCGYLTSLLATLGSHVHSVETDADLSKIAGDNLAVHTVDNVSLEIGNAANGWDAHQPYDVVVVNGALPSLPQALCENLTIGGRLIAIIGKAPVMEALLIQRVGDSNWSDVALFETDLRPLPDTENRTGSNSSQSHSHSSCGRDLKVIKQMSVGELKERLDERGHDFVLLDVREPWELQICSLPDSVEIPMGQVPARLDEIDPEQDIVIICHHGVRSQQVAYYLQSAGHENLYNLRGGISAWSREIDSSVPTY